MRARTRPSGNLNVTGRMPECDELLQMLNGWHGWCFVRCGSDYQGITDAGTESVCLKAAAVLALGPQAYGSPGGGRSYLHRLFRDSLAGLVRPNLAGLDTPLPA